MNLRKIVNDKIALEKKILSFFKSKWDFYDYPIEVVDISLFLPKKHFTYQACIINWPDMIGFGDTREKAILNLKDGFELYRVENEKLPRPGIKFSLLNPVRVQFNTSEQIDKYSDIEQDFFDKVLKYFIKGVLYMSDDTTLSIYEPNNPELAKKQRVEIIERIYSNYGLDITELYDGPIYKIFELISQKQEAS